jgi:hypothetical protein
MEGTRLKAVSMIVLERAGDRWKVVEAGVAASGIVIRRARLLSHVRSKPDGAAETLPSLGNRVQVVLVAGSDRAICRRMQVPAASEEDTHRMVAVRLETELPYPVAESFWACERLNGGADGEPPVLVLAIPRVEVTDAEQVLGSTARHPWAVQLGAGALAELARASQKTPEETVALCRIEENTTDLVIVRGGRLEYARRIFAGLPATADRPAAESRAPEAAVARLGDELDQCIHHYALDSRDAGAEPARLVVVGEGAGADDRITQALGQRLGLPACRFSIPPGVQMIQGTGEAHGSPLDWLSADRLSAQFAACLGALLAAQQELRGENAAAPPLRRRRAPAWAALPRRRAALACLSAALICAIIAVSFLVRHARYNAASQAVRKGLPFLQDMDRLQNEVDVLEQEKRLARRSMLDTMLALAETLPKGIQIATLTVSTSGKLALTGTCGSVEDVSEKAVAALKASKMFANPKFLGASKQDQAFKFRLTFELRNRPERSEPDESPGREATEALSEK